MSTKPKLKLIPLPSGLPKLPRGAVYLGKGQTFGKPGHFTGWRWSPEFIGWAEMLLSGRIESWHYAAPRDSAIAREILGSASPAPKKAAKKEVPKKTKKPRVQRSKRIGVMPTPAAPVQDAIRLRFEKFGKEFCQIAERDGIDLPDWLPALPPVPAGFDRWEPRGMGWRADRARYACCSGRGWTVRVRVEPAHGFNETFYIEAVRDEKPPVADDIVGVIPEESPASALATQVGGNHYKDFAIQPVEFCQRNGLGYCESAVVKYVCRHRSKNRKEDIEKAIHYLNLLLEIEYPNQ